MCLQDLPSLSVVQLHPIVFAILYLAGALQCLCEQFTEIVIIGRVLKAKIAHITQVLVELLCDILVQVQISNREMLRTRERITQVLNGSGLLLLANLLVLLLVGGRLQSLPGEPTA